ncbi:MAG: hypothetical protein J6A97_03675 [Clostridia bacterium]|nr:hypothetical protein [Clostridia bacterium]
MIQEYLFVGDEHKAEVEKYAYKTVKTEIYDIENSDCWIATFSLDGENEKSATALSIVHEYVMSHFRPTVLSNGCSAYYNKALYPHFNEFERKLRKLLYLKSALSNDKKDSETIKDLESKDFGEIFTLLFSDAQFVQNVKKSVNDKTWQFTKDEILTALQHITENTLWDKLIGENAVPLLRTDFAKVKDYRNDVMHAHSMNSSSFSSAMKLVKKINEQLDIEIGKIIVEKMPETQSGEDFNTAISVAIKDMDAAKQTKSWQEQLAEIQATISSIKGDGIISALEEYRRLASSPEFASITSYLQSSEFAAIQQQIQEISKIQVDIPPALKELQEIVAKNKVDIPPAVLELQKTLQAFKPDPAITEWARIVKDITGGTN